MPVDFGMFRFKKFMLSLTENKTHLHTFITFTFLYNPASKHLSICYLRRFSSVCNVSSCVFFLPPQVALPAHTFKSQIFYSLWAAVLSVSAPLAVSSRTCSSLGCTARWKLRFPLCMWANFPLCTLNWRARKCQDYGNCWYLAFMSIILYLYLVGSFFPNLSPQSFLKAQSHSRGSCEGLAHDWSASPVAWVLVRRFHLTAKEALLSKSLGSQAVWFPLPGSLEKIRASGWGRSAEAPPPPFFFWEILTI